MIQQKKMFKVKMKKANQMFCLPIFIGVFLFNLLLMLLLIGTLPLTLNYSLLATQIIILVLAIANFKKAFWNQLNLAFLFIELSVLLGQMVYSGYLDQYGRYKEAFLGVMIIGQIVIIISVFNRLNNIKDRFIERAVKCKKINIEKGILYANRNWPSLHESDNGNVVYSPVIPLFIVVGIPIAIFNQRTGFFNFLLPWAGLLGCWFFSALPEIFIWRVKWLLDWQRESKRTIKIYYIDN